MTNTLDSKIHGVYMGPTWDPPGADRTQVGPMLAVILAIWGQ